MAPRTRSTTKKKINASQLRSAIAPLVRDVKELEIFFKTRHIRAMKSTPFKLLFMALVNDKMTSNKDTRKGNSNIVKILDSYNPIQKGFLIGGQCLSIKAEDISVIVGIPIHPKIKNKEKKEKKWKKEKSGKKEKKGKKESTVDSFEVFMDTYFPKGIKIKKHHIMEKLRLVVKIRSNEAVHDFKVLSCCLICCILFFNNSSGFLSKTLVKTIYHDMNQVRWAEEILETLMNNVEKYNNEGSVPGGCTIALLYWLAEHVKLTSMRKERANEIPRAIRWDISDIDEAISRTDLSSINDRMIQTTLTLSGVEDKIIQGKIYDGDVEVVGKNEEDFSDYFDKDEEEKAIADLIDGVPWGGVDFAALEAEIKAEIQTEIQAEIEDDGVHVQAEVEGDGVDVHFQGLQAEVEELRKQVVELKGKLEKSHKKLKKVKKVMKKGNQRKFSLFGKLKKTATFRHLKRKTTRRTEEEDVVAPQSGEDVDGSEKYDWSKCMLGDGDVEAVRAGVVGDVEVASAGTDVSEGLDVAPISAQQLPVKKRKRSHTPGSVEKGVKNNPRNKRKPLDEMFVFTGQPRDKAVIDVDTLPDANEVTEKVKPLSRSPFYHLMTDEQKKTIKKFYDGAEYSKTAWSFSFFPSTIINAMMFEKVLFKGFIHCDIIDWYGNYLSRSHEPNNKFIIFPTCLAVYIKEDKSIKRCLIQRLINELNEDVEYLLFPFNSGGKHWVLLILDIHTWNWEFYDSLSPPQDRKHRCLEHAEKLKNRLYIEVSSIAKRKGIQVAEEMEVISMNCTYQEAASNACALHVMHYMTQKLKDNGFLSMSQEVSPTTIIEFRVKMLVDVLDDASKLRKEGRS